VSGISVNLGNVAKYCLLIVTFPRFSLLILLFSGSFLAPSPLELQYSFD
jgi:hypothetical protein